MKKLLYSGLATIIFIPCLAYTSDGSTVKATEISQGTSETTLLDQDLGTFTHEGTTYTYTIVEDNNKREVSLNNGQTTDTAVYDKTNNKLFLNGQEVDSETKAFVDEISQDGNNSGQFSIQGYGDVPSGYKYVKGSTVKGSWAFVNAGLLSVIAIIAASSLTKNFTWRAITGIASAIIGTISTPSFSIYWTRKTYKKKKGKKTATGWQLRIYRDSKRKKLIHKEWAAIGPSSII
ncbi:hypothetical protein VSK91_06595 [Bacillus swezeyi]|uniref:Uncharacterized protein n=1 Tax=Bacillus swezeyi TaxID=1925020 RepID=A0A5M8RST6_9BACI|nr:hypothetical protein [Bacillus swezeyi]KAA6450430.1 hypothetical protein DX927_06020 [Bacillus swezeyi]TYS36969.1 hypothetical protein FZC77_05875 [Bacillus swezeyi]